MSAELPPGSTDLFAEPTGRPLASHAIVMADPTGVICFWSAGAERLFGHRASDAVGQSLDLIVPETCRERHWAAFYRTMRTGESRLDQAAANIPVVCHDGNTVRFPGRFIILRDALDKVIGAIALYAAIAEPNSSTLFNL